MDEDQILQSIIADPDVVDPTIDVSKLRKTTPTSPRLLGNVSGIAGLRFDPTRTDYVRDLYSVYGGGLPTIDVAPVVDTTTPTVDTTTPTVDIGGGGGDTDQVASVEGITPTETITQPSFDDQFQSIEDIGTPIDVGFGEGQVDPRLAAGLEGPIVDTSPVTPTITAPSGDVFAVDDPLAEEKIDFTPETQGLVDQAFSKVGSTASDIMNDLSQIPGAIADFANQTVDIAGQKINVGKTLLKAGINKIVGGPISLVFDAIGALGLEGGRGDVSDALAAKYGRDDIGRLTSGVMAGYSVGPNFAQTIQNRIDNIKNRTAPQTDASRKTIAELEQIKAETISAGSSGVITEPGTVVATGEIPVTRDEIDAFNAPPADINIVDEVALTGLLEPEITADAGFEDTGRSDTGSVSTAGQAGPPSQRGGGADIGSAVAIGSAAAAAAQDAARGSYGGPPSQSGGGGSSGGGGKIVCTMMNNSYGFGSFRNKIWLKHSKDLAPEYQIGYHKIFLPLVRLSKTNKLLKKTLEHIAVHRTIDIRQEARGKVHLLGRVYRKILEPICYWVGKYAKR
tara:strand:+ start:687 stop:2384 length:1698 start_codon:yes stop_codon:yes gene_type:complete